MEQNRSSHIAFRVSDKERRLLDIMAQRENRDRSEMIRELIREGAARRNLYEVGFVQFMTHYEKEAVAAQVKEMGDEHG